MKYYFTSGMKDGKYVAAIFEAENKGQLLADMTKNRIMINCITEFTKEERDDFEKKMNSSVEIPKKKVILPK